jgi:hypothetical protein
MNEQDCQFGLCRREPEVRVVVARDADDLEVLVCGLHVNPLLSWGLPEPLQVPAIQVLRRVVS